MDRFASISSGSSECGSSVAIFKYASSAATELPDSCKPLASVSYAPFEGIRKPEDTPTPAQIRADLKAIAPYTNAIRTYRSTRGMGKGLMAVKKLTDEFSLDTAPGRGTTVTCLFRGDR